MQLSGARVVVTGASGGIGHAIATSLAAAGADLVLTGRRAEVLEALATRLGARAVVADLGTDAGLETLAGAAGEVDIVVANAALPASGRLADFDVEAVDRCLSINLRAPILLAHRFTPAMISRGRGHLCFISSLAGMSATPVSSIYSATKFGLRGFSHSLRQDLHSSGVGSSVILPGFVRDAGIFADSGAKLPFGMRTSSPEEVAAAVLRSIRQNRAEIVVAPRELHLGALLAGLAPGIASSVTRRFGAHRIATDIAAGQRDRR